MTLMQHPVRPRRGASRRQDPGLSNPHLEAVRSPAENTNIEIDPVLPAWQDVQGVNFDKSKAEHAFREAVPSLQPLLYKIALKQCRNSDVARDLVQDTFERGFHSLHHLREDTNLSAWLTCILRNRLIDHFRVESRRLVEPMEAIPDVVVVAEESKWTRITPDDLAKAVKLLPEKYRLVYELFVIERMQQEAIARKLGIAIGTVASRFRRARDKLKVMLVGESGEEGEK